MNEDVKVINRQKSFRERVRRGFVFSSAHNAIVLGTFSSLWIINDITFFSRVLLCFHVGKTFSFHPKVDLWFCFSLCCSPCVFFGVGFQWFVFLFKEVTVADTFNHHLIKSWHDILDKHTNMCIQTLNAWSDDWRGTDDGQSSVFPPKPGGER